MDLNQVWDPATKKKAIAILLTVKFSFYAQKVKGCFSTYEALF